ncbi:hypothetical protein LTR41_006359 [Exophiala xenobiotica]|nr:hypothetical protein LTR41_006359 [Exophiala xenobiotica]
MRMPCFMRNAHRFSRFLSLGRPTHQNPRFILPKCVPGSRRNLVTEPSSLPTSSASSHEFLPKDVQTRLSITSNSPSNSLHNPKRLPVSCPGCGALTQEVDPGEAGYYTRSRKNVKTYLRSSDPEAPSKGQEDGGTETADGIVPGSEDAVRQQNEDQVPEAQQALLPPVCDRCHSLIHEARGNPIAHPSIEDIADSIAESPFSRNHVYHVLDAADFPMSLIPSLSKKLSLAKPRSQNRRSQHSFSHKPALSFIITRSDLLGPSKEMVDRMMPKFLSILRIALGRAGQTQRLGNVHLVSSKRGWWSKEIKEDIRERGGGNWLVGKFNVGKSNLFEVLFPKGSTDQAPDYEELQRQQEAEALPAKNDFLQENSLLPPPQPEVPFPAMPLVSSLPGTTASPIRLPFGNSKGELIDLPGLERGGLDKYVQPEHKLELIMEHRPTVTQYNIKPGQSLLLGGGLVRITPFLDENDPSTIVMAYPFVPLKAHVTSTEKALGTQLQQRESGIESILAEGVGVEMASAGRFSLRTNVTKSRAGSVIRAGVDPAKLPFQVYATDILIEGVGWVELVCQVRKSRINSQPTSAQEEPAKEETVEEESAKEETVGPAVPTSEQVSIESTGFVPFNSPLTVSNGEASSNFPQVEIFTPEGKSVGQRECLDVWQTWHTGKARNAVRSARPRRPMKGAKKREKLAKRAAAAAAKGT